MTKRENRKPKSDNAGFLATLREAQEVMRPFFDERRAVEDRECPPRLEKLRKLHVDIKWSGGNCPVQIEGHVKGKPFYFRARGEHWSLGIGGEPVGQPDWYCEEPYGSWPDAGWMHLHEAYDSLIEGILKWRPNLAQGTPTRRSETETGPAPKGCAQTQSGDQ